MYFKRSLSLIFFLIFSIDSLSQTDWSHWGNNAILNPRDIFYPNNIEDVICIIKSAYENNYKVRAIGSCHSWSNLVNTDGYIINTDNLNKILYIDKENRKVKVECGIKLNELFCELAKEGLSLSNQGFIDKQSIVGAVSTGTHGTGHTGSLSDFIIEFEVIDCFGNMHKASQDNNGQWLSILRVGLGALGFIYSVTLECQDLAVLKHKRVISSWDKALKDYMYNYENNDYYMFIGHLESDVVLNFFWNKTKEEIKNPIIPYMTNWLVANRTLSTFVGAPIINYMPKIGRNFMRLWLYGMQTKNKQPSYRSLSPLKNPVTTAYYIEAEYAIDIKDFISAMEKVRRFYNEYQVTNQVTLVSLITCRFAPASTRSYLSLSYKRETAYITINIINYFDSYIDFFEKVEQLLAGYQPRPHWGKFHLLNEIKIQSLFQEGFEKFNNLRAILDPVKMFSNNFIERCFG